MTKSVELTQDEVEALTDYIDSTLIAYISDKSNYVSNLNWIHLMTGIWRKLELEKKGKSDD